MTEKPSKFVVGIDLGTTNSAVAYADATDGGLKVRDFPVPQLVAPSTVEARPTLPSFHYQAAAGEFADDALRLPFDDSNPNFAVGFFARDHGAASTGRLVVSAKSWLCHAGVDRTAGLLPWHGAADVDRLSPVDVSARYLQHVHRAWDAAHPNDPLEKQDVILTVPASFDEVARELTANAAIKAGLANVVLLEEPQAAFYAWLHDHADAWEAEVLPGQRVLVCDIGGGTSDFTLIEARKADGGKVQFHRVAVGDHLILGGDNLDVALAHHVEKKIGDAKLDPRRWGALVRLCRQAKETLLGHDAPEGLTINVPSTGARIIGGSTQVPVTRAEIEALLIDGFLPRVDLGEKPAARRSGFQEFGLPYAADAAVTRYLAAFLTAHAAASARPDVLLLNGGFFESPALTQRVLDVLAKWFGTPPKVLPNARLDLAVARGAAHYGLVRRGHGLRISGGSAQAYYVGVEATDGRAAICLLPAGTEEGQTADLSGREFKLLIRQPVEFPLFVSSVRTNDAAGQLIEIDPLQLTELPPIRTVLHSGRTKVADTLAVTLHARRTEIGTLELWCAEARGDRTWKLQFDVRAAGRPGMETHAGEAETQGFVERQVVDECAALIRDAFRGKPTDKPEGLVKRLETATNLPRADWPASLLRGFWEVLLEVEDARRLSVEHEARWLNLAGYALRPGYGLAVDDWRVAQTWRLQSSRVRHEKNEQARAEWWVLWRRIAGGLTPGQQHTLADPHLGTLRTYLRKLGTKKASPLGLGPHEGAEVLRLLGSLELLKVAIKLELGEMLLHFATREKASPFRDAGAWALGRLASRVPIYGPLNAQPPVDDVEKWVRRLIELPMLSDKSLFALVQMGRLTGDRYRDLTQPTREALLGKMARINAPDHFMKLVCEGGELAADEQKLAFGETLPRGLRIE